MTSRTTKTACYSAAPELGLDGRWALDVRLTGLDNLVAACAGKSVLDLGAAEGLIARCLLQCGASLVHGFELVPARVDAADRICGSYPNAVFRQADLSDWEAFENSQGDGLLPVYDIVLYLGLHHHLPESTRMATLSGAASLCRDLFAIRTPSAFYDADCIGDRLVPNGFDVWDEHLGDASESLGPLRIFRRRGTRRDG